MLLRMVIEIFMTTLLLVFRLTTEDEHTANYVTPNHHVAVLHSFNTVDERRDIGRIPQDSEHSASGTGEWGSLLSRSSEKTSDSQTASTSTPPPIVKGNITTPTATTSGGQNNTRHVHVLDEKLADPQPENNRLSKYSECTIPKRYEPPPETGVNLDLSAAEDYITENDRLKNGSESTTKEVKVHHQATRLDSVPQTLHPSVAKSSATSGDGHSLTNQTISSTVLSPYLNKLSKYSRVRQRLSAVSREHAELCEIQQRAKIWDRSSVNDMFISKEESHSFLSRQKRRSVVTKNTGLFPLKALNSEQFKNFRYQFPPRREWFPTYVNVWDQCVYKTIITEGLIGRNRKKKWCNWEEVWEFHKVYMRSKGFTYEMACAIRAYIICLRDTTVTNREEYCPKPCMSNPCRGPHMSQCKQTGKDVTRSYTCICQPGYKYNERTKKCDDMKICGTKLETCNRVNTQECKDGRGLKHECVCKRRWMGATCTKPYDACVDYDNPCGSHGRCESHAGQRTWTCKCVDGWGDDPDQEGRDCNRKDKVCDNIVCLNGGECQQSTSGQIGTCICSKEWTGNRCDKPMPAWTMWQPWAKCSATCGYGGTRIRKRDCDHKGATFCGPGNDEEHAECNGPVCKVDGEWSEWIKVTDCSYNCGGGHYIKTRNCVYDTDDPEAFGEKCPGRSIVYADCNIMSCPKSNKRWLRVHINSLARTIVSQTDSALGDWGAWDSWTECSQTCDVGFRSRARICLSSIGACEGSAEEVADCTTKLCDNDDGFLGWGTWSFWSKCTAGNDFCYRYRECPYGIKDKEFREACPGKSSQSVPCNGNSCEEPQEVVQDTREKDFKSMDAGEGRVRYPVNYEGGFQREMTSRRRAGAGGETSAVGLGGVAAIVGIGYMGKIVFKKWKKRQKSGKKGSIF